MSEAEKPVKIATLVPPLPVKVWTQDESRFGLMTTLRRRLTMRGIKPLAKYQHEFENTYLYGAVEPLTGGSFFLELPYLDSQNFQVFLDYFSQAYGENLNLVVLDNGGFHKAQELRLPEHIRFIFTPPYTPEVNPMERVYEDVKERTAVEIYPTLDDLSNKLCAIIQGYSASQLSRMTSYPFFIKGAKAVTVWK